MHFDTANTHVKGCKIMKDFLSKEDPFGLRSPSPMVKRSLDKAEFTATAFTTNPEQPAGKKLKTKEETATCIDKDPPSGLDQSTLLFLNILT